MISQDISPGGHRHPGAGVSRLRAVLDRIEIVDSDLEDTALLGRLADVTRPTVVSFVNHHALNQAWSIPEFARHLLDADVLLRDGGVSELALALFGRAPGHNMNGTDFIPRLIDRFVGRRVAVYGTAEPWISKAAARLSDSGVEIVSVRHGFDADDDYVRLALADAPDLIVLAMGMPKQERVAAAIAAAARGPIVIVNGGAIADYLSNRFPRAPLWMRRSRLEWVFRLWMEPGRLWRRYVIGGILIVWRLAVTRGTTGKLSARRCESSVALE